MGSACCKAIGSLLLMSFAVRSDVGCSPTMVPGGALPGSSGAVAMHKSLLLADAVCVDTCSLLLESNGAAVVSPSGLPVK